MMLDVGQANELKLAFRRANWSNDDIKRLCEGNVLADVRSVLRGHTFINVINVINCDADPFNPWANDGFTIEEHQKGGQWKFDPTHVEFFLASDQKDDKVIEGNKLCKELAKKLCFNANILDYLLENPHLIPEEWKMDGNGNTRYIFFWGTIYRYGGSRRIRCLYWGDGRWDWSYGWPDRDWYGDSPAAVRAS